MKNEERWKARIEGCHNEYSDGNTRGYVFEVSVIVYCRRIRVILQETSILLKKPKTRSKMADYDLTQVSIHPSDKADNQKLIPHLDRHLAIPLLNHLSDIAIYPAEQLAKAQ